MGKFGSQFFEKSPIKEVAKGRASRLRKRAQRRSERSGETGGYDYSDMKVLKLLGKAKRIENKNFIKDTGAKKGSKRKGSMYGEDPRIQASFERPDVNDSSPLQGAYAAGAGGEVYVSNREDFQNLQDRITGATIMAIEGEKDPETRSKRLEKRIDARNKRKDKDAFLKSDKPVENPNFDPSKKISPDNPKIITEFDLKTQELEGRKEGFDEEIKQQKKDRRSRNFLSAKEKTEIVKQHFFEEGLEEQWDAMTPKQKKEAVLDFRTYYGFND